MNIAEHLAALANRATVRAYDPDRKPTREEIEELLAVAAQAPNTGNMQLYSVVVTMEPARLKRMQELHFGQPMAGSCGALLTFCADLRRFDRWCSLNDTQSGLNNFHGRLLSVIDATIFAEQLVCAAETAGLGTCYLGTVTYNLAAFVEELQLPEGVLPLFSISVGWPLGPKPERTERLPLEAVVHFEEYRDFSDRQIADLYAEKEARPDSARFVEENGKANLAQVYAEVRYPAAMNEEISAALDARWEK